VEFQNLNISARIEQIDLPQEEVKRIIPDSNSRISSHPYRPISCRMPSLVAIQFQVVAGGGGGGFSYFEDRISAFGYMWLYELLLNLLFRFGHFRRRLG
jgi:hypothetical protein